MEKAKAAMCMSSSLSWTVDGTERMFVPGLDAYAEQYRCLIRKRCGGRNGPSSVL